MEQQPLIVEDIYGEIVVRIATARGPGAEFRPRFLRVARCALCVPFALLALSAVAALAGVIVLIIECAHLLAAVEDRIFDLIDRPRGPAQEASVRVLNGDVFIGGVAMPATLEITTRASNKGGGKKTMADILAELD